MRVPHTHWVVVPPMCESSPPSLRGTSLNFTFYAVFTNFLCICLCVFASISTALAGGSGKVQLWVKHTHTHVTSTHFQDETQVWEKLCHIHQHIWEPVLPSITCGSDQPPLVLSQYELLLSSCVLSSRFQRFAASKTKDLPLPFQVVI